MLQLVKVGLRVEVVVKVDDQARSASETVGLSISLQELTRRVSTLIALKSHFEGNDNRWIGAQPWLVSLKVQPDTEPFCRSEQSKYLRDNHNKPLQVLVTTADSR